jgi:hypothetical protein
MNQQPPKTTRERSGTTNLSSYWTAPVRTVAHIGHIGPCWRTLTELEDFHRRLLHQSDQSKPENPKSSKQTFRAPKLTKLETATTRNTRELTKTFIRAKPNQWSALVKLVKTWALEMNSNPQVNSSKSKSQSPNLLHGSAQDFGDSRSTSWAFHIHDLVPQNLLNQKESKDFQHEHL